MRPGQIYIGLSPRHQYQARCSTSARAARLAIVDRNPDKAAKHARIAGHYGIMLLVIEQDIAEGLEQTCKVVTTLEGPHGHE